MINTDLLENIIADQNENFRSRKTGITRKIDFQKFINTKQIVIVSGVRRSGKSTLLRQFAEHYKDFCFVNFDDERLINFSLEDVQNLLVIFRKNSNSKIFFFDEIQNIDKWEFFIRRIYDEGYKIFITGSNARLLSSDLATKLTGRYFKIELFPFSFLETLKFENIDYNDKTTTSKAKILKCFENYLKHGGFPEYLATADREYLDRIYEDIIYRDIIARYKIREIKAFKELSNYLFSNFTKLINYHSLKKILNFKSVTSVKNYISFMQECYLLFEVYKYDYSLKKQYISEKKYFVIDNGLRNRVSFSFSEDSGRLLKNLIFIELKRSAKEIYFHKSKQECDFIIRERNKIVSAIQVVFNFEDENTKKREIEGLLDAMEYYNLQNGTIITKSVEDILKIKKKNIKIIPAWKWLINVDYFQYF